jgi:4-hydroxy-2-oxoheptanedioate aldolase
MLGTVVACGDPALAELLAMHLDFLWIDLEHSALDIKDVQSLSIAARASAAAALVRVPDAESALLTALLDIGVDGVIAPRIEDVACAKRFADRLRYPPNGSRGFAHRRRTSFGLDGAAAEQAPLCLVQIESAAAVEQAAQIARVPGVDGLIVGPSDLALDLGVDHGLDSPELLQALRTVQQAAGDAGVIVGLAAGGEVEVLRNALGTASTLLAYSTDVRIYAAAIQAAAGTMASTWRDEQAAVVDSASL